MNTSTFAGAAAPAAQAKASVYRFIEIERDAPNFLVRQLVKHDSVHFKGAEGEELRDFRLGGTDYDRTCYAMVEDKGGVVVHAAIYVKKLYGTVSSPEDLCGDVAAILNSKSEKNSDDPTQAAFYSISNITKLPGMGQRLVTALYAHLAQHMPQAVWTTLSPCRTFDQDFTQEDSARFNALSLQEKAKEVVNYILTGKDVMVQGFHMGNGATPADVNFNAGDIERVDATGELKPHLAMINYWYNNDPDVIEKRAVAYAEIKKILRNDKTDAGAQKVRELMLPLVGRELLQKAGMMTPELSLRVSQFESQRVAVITIAPAAGMHLRA